MRMGRRCIGARLVPPHELQHRGHGLGAVGKLRVVPGALLQALEVRLHRHLTPQY